MNPCNEVIERLYRDPFLDKLINSINPEGLRNELKQELAVVLLEYDCDKLLEMSESGKLMAFAKRTAWKMGTLPNGRFFKLFRKNRTIELTEGEIPDITEEDRTEENAEKIKKRLSDKLQSDANNAHEAIIFEKYLELESAQKVAEFFNIPRLHAFQVIKKVKIELKKNLKK